MTRTEIVLNTIEYLWTNGMHEDFQRFYQITENYYSEIVGGEEHRKSFIPFNISDAIHDVIIAYMDGIAIGCAGLKKYSESDIEVKRVWVEPEYRGNHIASDLMKRIESKAKEQGYQRTILQTREIMTDAVRLYKKLGYYQISNYPPYDEMDGAICLAKEL
ncbi:MAG: GNAT family N-acetyltransferase [Lachnospiraceae bacterium]|nr:GNAT family N-acetyltransferase [Lachnospiraceae bacterium]